MMWIASWTQQGGAWGPWGHMGYMGSWIMWLFWIGLLVLIFVAIWALLRSVGDGSGRPAHRDDAEEILKQRYARGEIDEDTYRRMRQSLRE